MSDTPHIPVLLNKVLDDFKSVNDGIIIDCTLGYGGHSKALLETNDNVRVIGIDKDQTAINFALKYLNKFKDRFECIKGDFAMVFDKALKLAKNRELDVRAILADIGVSSLQLDQNNRGFGFNSENLDMRMDQDSKLSAFHVVNEYSHEKLMDIFFKYGEIPYGSDLAKKIILKRQTRPITSAKDLAKIANTFKTGKKLHPATLMFQAIRIEVNDELEQLRGILEKIEKATLKNCIISIITFHSLEDRIVKQRFKTWSTKCICSPFAIRCECKKNHQKGELLHKKPFIADANETKNNPRSRSAKLRSFYFGTKTTF